MKTFISLIASLAIIFIIISPFFWLKFLKVKNLRQYALFSSVISLGMIGLYLFWLDNFIREFFAKYNTNLYYLYYDIGEYTSIIIIIIIIIFPFIFTKAVWGRFRLKSFFLSTLFSIIIFASLFLFFAYYIFPKAGEMLLNNI